MPTVSAGQNVLVIGDLILDIYHYGRLLKDSVEGLLAIGDDRTEISFGGAGLLVRNIVQLGGSVNFVSVIGNDEFGDLAQKFTPLEIDRPKGPSGAQARARFLTGFTHKNLKKTFFVENGRKTTVKERFVVNGRKVLKWNRLDNRKISSAIEKRILFYLSKNLRNYNKLVISDYRHGLISQNFAKVLVKLGKKFKKPVYVDSQIAQSRGNHGWYSGADLICLNVLEAQSIDKNTSLQRISQKLQIPGVVIKRGARGSIALLNTKIVDTPGFHTKAIDTTGAGDAFFAALAISNFPPRDSDLKLANKWAALTTTKIGTELPSKLN